ncbi:SWIRM-domain-containing protein [Hyaloraphidium curvatum]|nr:SWIRM-domain-containing protein [Hyaloraphidium curvatum]
MDFDGDATKRDFDGRDAMETDDAADVEESAAKRLRLAVAEDETVPAVQQVDLDEATQNTSTKRAHELQPLPDGKIMGMTPVEGDEDEAGGDDHDGSGQRGDGQGGSDEPRVTQTVVFDDGSLANKTISASEAIKRLPQQTHEIIIPSYAAWFDFSKIHDTEKKALPEFFNNRNRSKTPTVYKDYRDFMINSYRLNPSQYLTVTACRRCLAGDVCAIIRVHAFLEQWGLINYQVDPDARPSTFGPAFTGHFRVTADTPKGLVPFQPNAPTAVAVPKTSIPSTNLPAAGKAAQLPTNLPLRKDVYEDSKEGVADDAKAKSPEPSETKDSATEASTRYNCATCGVDCTKQRYHSVKARSYEICPNCYFEGRFPSTMFSGDFVRMDTSPGSLVEDTWSDQETLLLLEGLEMFDDNWDLVAEHVATRTREQCILKFLKLPIEDPYLGTKQESLGPLQHQRIPFSQADNPVMSLVAFLASVVNPGVASAAAQAALKELSQGAEAADNGDQMVIDVATKPGEPKANGEDKPAFGTEAVQKAAGVALGAAAAKAKVLADYEEREMQRLVNTAIELQLRKLEVKMKHFEEMESMLDNERRELERQRQLLFAEKVALRRQYGDLIAQSAQTTHAVPHADAAGAGESSAMLTIG